ncbi:MAG TPA: hypothetical protein VGE37_01880, partial [Archangium sp.]
VSFTTRTAMVKVEPIPDGTRFSNGEGSIEVSFPARHLVINRYHGHAQAELAAPVLAELSRTALSAPHGLCVMNDAEGLTDYDSGFRQQWTEWVRLNRRHIKAFHLLHSSSVIRVGVKLANVIVGDVIKSYPDRSAFDAAIMEFRRRPPG